MGSSLFLDKSSNFFLKSPILPGLKFTFLVSCIFSLFVMFLIRLSDTGECLDLSGLGTRGWGVGKSGLGFANLKNSTNFSF